MTRSRLGELRQALGQCRKHLAAVGLFSVFVNLLMLTSPLFMLQIYDRVLASRSEATLLALLVLVTVLFAFMGILDFVRGRVLARAGAKFQEILDARVFTAVLQRSVLPVQRALPNTASRDLDSVRQVLSGPAPFAVFDLPWTPIFIAAIFLFHPMLGWLAVAGSAILVCLTALNQYRSREPNAESQTATNEAEVLGEALRQNAEAVQGLGMRGTGLNRWSALRRQALDRQITASDRTASYASASKALRFYLQSLILALGAWLVLRQQISPGMMIASSILLGRALAPVDQAIGQWPALQRARQGWTALAELLEKSPEQAGRTALPTPRGVVDLQNVAVFTPGEQKPALVGISFRIEPGQALGVIGPSGAGKTTLAKLLTGIWQPAQGKVRIDGAAADQWPDGGIGRHLGYLPQDMSLFSGTVAQNIARLSPEPDDAKVVEAAERAGAHEILLELSQGYDTEIGAGGQRLSGGQRQRVALARALYDDPPILILDEPNANLDAAGEQALVQAIRDAKARGRTVVVMAHRPSAIAACDLLLMIDKGRQVDLGPRDEVLKRRAKNYTQLVAGKEDAARTRRQTEPPSGNSDAAAGVQGASPADQPIAPRIHARQPPSMNTEAAAAAVAEQPLLLGEAQRLHGERE